VKYFKTNTVFPYKWELILLLWLAFFFNQADRLIFNVVLPSIRTDLNLGDSDMGLIASIAILSIWNSGSGCRVYRKIVPIKKMY
jgi:sugar phosphate permease